VERIHTCRIPGTDANPQAHVFDVTTTADAQQQRAYNLLHNIQM
jgi:hypothetical protein